MKFQFLKFISKRENKKYHLLWLNHIFRKCKFYLECKNAEKCSNGQYVMESNLDCGVN